MACLRGALRSLANRCLRAAYTAIVDCASVLHSMFWLFVLPYPPYLGRTRRAGAPYVTPCEGRTAPAALPSFADDVASLVVVLVVSLAGSVGVAHKLNSQVRGNCDWGARARITE